MCSLFPPFLPLILTLYSISTEKKERKKERKKVSDDHEVEQLKDIFVRGRGETMERQDNWMSTSYEIYKLFGGVKLAFEPPFTFS